MPVDNHKIPMLPHLLLFLLLCSIGLFAQTEMSGFFDIIYSNMPTRKETGGFDINQFEIDISKAYKGHLSFGSAIAYDSSSGGSIKLNMVYLHYNFIHPSVKHPRRVEEDEHVGIVIGKFDVPIGLDYLSYASPDRPVVTQPLIIEYTIAGWNDIGTNLHINKKRFRLNVSVVNGFNKGINFVGDFVYKFTPRFKIGVFHTSDFNRKFIQKSRLSGAYVFAEWSVCELKSEFIWANGIYGGEQDTMGQSHHHDGFYVQIVSYLDRLKKPLPWFFTVRYSLWQDENSNSPIPMPEKIDRYVFGIGYQLKTYSSFRLEYLVENPKGEKYLDRLTAQLVVSF